MAVEDNWRDAANYHYLNDLNASELAWEFLRRNSEYELEALSLDPADQQAASALAAHWGLRFPDTAKSARYRSGYLLEPERRSDRTHSRAADFSHHDDARYRDRSDQYQIS